MTYQGDQGCSRTGYTNWLEKAKPVLDPCSPPSLSLARFEATRSITGWDANLLKGYPQHFIRLPWQFPHTHLQSWTERGTITVKCISKNTTHWPVSNPDLLIWSPVTLRTGCLSLTCTNIIRKNFVNGLKSDPSQETQNFLLHRTKEKSWPLRTWSGHCVVFLGKTLNPHSVSHWWIFREAWWSGKG